MFRSVNPATEELVAEYEADTPAAVAKKLGRARRAFDGWKRSTFDERAVHLKAAASLLRSRRAELATLMVAEMGKPVAAAEQEVDKCAAACDHFAETAEVDLEPTRIRTDAGDSYVRFDPLGPVLAIMPWNFPLWQVFRFAAPNVMAGNAGLLKHAPNVMGCAAAVEDIFHDAGFPDGVFQSLRIDEARVAGVIGDDAVAAVTLTGSERAGRAVAAAAGGVGKKAVLELGGSDPFLVLADADVHATASAAAAARCLNNGQSCIAAKRFIVDESIADEFEAAFAMAMAERVVGDPMNRRTQVGPLARKDLLDHLQDQVVRSVAAGARVVLGGHGRDRGWFFAPAVLADCRPGMACFDEETFGPVAAVTRAADEHEMVNLANATRYGLGASIWTSDDARGERMAVKLDAGMVYINAAVASDARLPFGGIKASGFGRELSMIGLREFVNVKTVWRK